MNGNEKQDYIVLRKDLYEKYGLKKGLIIQLLINGGGRFVGTIGDISKIITISSYEMIKQNIRELIGLGIIEKEHVDGHDYEYRLISCNTNCESNKKKVASKRNIPEHLRVHVEAIQKLRNEKYKIGE